MALAKIKSLLCKTPEQLHVFIANDIPIFEDNIQRLKYCYSIINRYKHYKFYYIGITKSPNKKIKKLKNMNNLYYLYCIIVLDYNDAKTVIDNLFEHCHTSNYCLNKSNVCEKTNISSDKYYVYIAVKAKLKYFNSTELIIV